MENIISKILERSTQHVLAEHLRPDLGPDSFEVKRSLNSVSVFWKVKRFSFNYASEGTIQSPPFIYHTVEWCLCVNPFKNVDSNKFVDVYLFVLSSLNEKTPNVVYKIALEDSSGQLQCIFEGSNTFKRSSRGGQNNGVISRDELRMKRGELLPDDTLTVFCELRVDDKPLPEQKQQDCNAPDPKSYIDILSRDFEALFKEGRKCDVSLHVGGETFKAHKIILGARSPVFSAMFDHNMEENQTSSVTIPDIHLLNFSAFLKYIYTGRIQDLSIDQAIGVYAAADKYDLKELKSHCRDMLLSGLSSELFFEIAILADKHNDGKLMDGAKLFARSNHASILSSEQWKDFLRESPDTALEILRSISSSFVTSS